jgi:hypothetical protein
VPGRSERQCSIASHGCIRCARARRRGNVELSSRVPIISRRFVVVSVAEVHRDVYKRGGATTADVSRALAQAGTGGLVEDRDVERIASGHSGRAMLLRLK